MQRENRETRGKARPSGESREAERRREISSEYDRYRAAYASRARNEEAPDLTRREERTSARENPHRTARREAEPRMSRPSRAGAALDRSFHLTAQPTGDPLQRDIQLLSAGAADQLYLAARLAICQLVLPEEKQVPIILDDALTNFDDERCAAALRLLKQEAAHRQILLFTCHSREAALLAGDPAVTVFHLGNSRSVASEC